MGPDEKQLISPMQLMGLLVLSRITPITVAFPLLSGTEKPQDAWIASLAGTLLAVPLVLLVVKLSLRHPGRTVIQYSQDVLGPLFGKLVGSLLAFYWLLTAADVARALGEAYVGGIMPETPMIVFLLTALLLGALTARCGIEVVGRMGEGAAYISLIFLLIVSILPYDLMRFENLRPFLAGGVAGLVRPVSIALAFFMQFLVLGMIVPCLNRPEKAPAFSLYSVLIGGFVLVWMSVVLVMVFGNRASALFLPAYALGRVISIAHFLERIEAIILGVFTVGSLIKIALFLWGAATALQQLLGLSENRCLFYPLAAVAANLGILGFRDYLEFTTFFLRSWPVFSNLMTITIIATLYVGSFLKSKKARRERS